MPQIMIRQHDGEHRLADGHGANAHAGIVPPLGGDMGFDPMAVDAPLGRQNRRGGLHGEPGDDGLARGYAAEHAARVIGQELGRAVRSRRASRRRFPRR